MGFCLKKSYISKIVTVSDPLTHFHDHVIAHTNIGKSPFHAHNQRKVTVANSLKQ